MIAATQDGPLSEKGGDDRPEETADMDPRRDLPLAPGSDLPRGRPVDRRGGGRLRQAFRSREPGVLPLGGGLGLCTAGLDSRGLRLLALYDPQVLSQRPG